MAYIGRTKTPAPLTSADIPDNIIQGGDIAYFENDSTTQYLGGTYSTDRMYLNDSYTLNADVNVTGHLALGTIAASDVVIMNDSTERTITGSGTLDSGNLLQDTHRTSLTNMTGELGSTVTGSPNLNLTTGSIGSGVTKKIHGFSAYHTNLPSASLTNAAYTEFTAQGGWNERWDSHGHLSEGRFTPTVQGVYLIGYSIAFGHLDNGEQMISHIRKNSVSDDVYGMVRAFVGFEGAGGNVDHWVSGSGLVQLDTDDYVSAWVYHNEGGAISMDQPNTQFWGCYIGTV